MYTAFIIFEILGVIFFLILLFIDEENKDYAIATMAISCLCFSMGIICFIVNDKPSALDVYQDKTTLEITYRDSIPVDSVVVFKKQF